jgi:glucokinase
MPVVAAVDIGGTQVKVGLVESGKVLTKEVIRITNYAGAAPLLSDIAQLVKQMANCIDQKPVGVGVACAGLVDRHAGRIISSPNIPFLDNCSLTPFLSDTLGIPSSLENDAMAAAMAEYLYGGWGTPNLLVTLTLGTGVGGGVIIDGSPLRGTTNNAAEFGHLKVPGLGPRKCECGSTGCLEAYVGSRGILQTARRLWNCQRDVTHCERFPWGTVTELAKSAINGDQIAVDTLRTTGEILGRGVAMLIDVFNPDLIVVTGGVAHAFEHLEEGVQSSLRNFCAFTATKDEALIVPSEQPSDSGLLGARPQ